MTEPAQTETPLKRLLTDEGRRQNWLADRTGIHESEISRIVKGMDPGQARARKIADELSQTCSDLGWPQYDPDAQAAA